jgi:RNA polymerase sigma factor (sigma-70 family)
MESLLERFRQLRKFLQKRGQTVEDAEDLIQEAYLRLHVYRQQKKVDQQDAFVMRTLLNLAVDRRRREHRNLYVAQTPEELALIDLKPSPDEELIHRERLSRAMRVLDGLAPRTREVFLMHRIEGYGCAQIAKTFDISVSAVEKHIARAVLALMDVVDE